MLQWTRVLALGAIFCACVIAAPAEASRRDQAACLIVTLGPRSHLTVNLLGAPGVTTCDAALTDPKRPVTDPMFKASLIRARALHRIAARDYDAALADLDLADQTYPSDDIFFQRSFPVANKMLRAFIRAQKGDKDGALELARAAVAARPYNVDLAYAASRLEYSVTSDLDGFLAQLRDQARFDPRRIQMLFVTALMRRKYEEAVLLYPHILLTVPQGRGGYRIDEKGIELENLVARAHLTGGHAYALAATGQPVLARSAIAAYRAEVETAMAEPAPIMGPDGKMIPSVSRTARWKRFLARKGEIDGAAGPLDQSRRAAAEAP